MSLQAKLNGCANSVVKSVTASLAWRVTYEHIEFKERGGERGHETKEVVTLETERTAIIYIYIYDQKMKGQDILTINFFFNK